MLLDTLSDLDWLAVVIATVAYYAIGAVWYAPPVFGKAWMKAMGIDQSDANPTVVTMVAPLIFYFLTVVVLGMIAKVTETMGAGDGVILGLITWIGFALPLTVVLAIYDPKKPDPGSWALITSAYHLVSLVVAATILGAMG